MKNTALILLSLIVTYAVLETANLGVSYYLQSNRIAQINSYSGKLTTDAKLGYKLKPNLDNYKWVTPASETIVSTDNLGFRNIGRNYKTAELLFVGDSFVEPQGVNSEQSFHYLLENELGGQSIISLATSGWAIAHYNAALKTYWDKVSTASEVILVLYANDFSQVRSDHLDPEFWATYFVKRDLPSLQMLWSESNLWHKAQILLDNWHKVSEPVAQCEQDAINVEGNKLLLSPRTQWNCEQCYESSVGEVLLDSFNFVKAQNQETQFHVLLIPAQEYIWQDVIADKCPDELRNILDATDLSHDFVKRLANEHGFSVIDSTPYLLSQFREGNRELFIANDGHLSVEGHKQLSIYLASVLSN